MPDAIAVTPSLPLADRIDAVLPQTQCTKCGFAGCRPYAEAIAAGTAEIDRCPPGGTRGIERLSALTGRPVLPLNPAHGVEGPLRVAVIDESLCIGCTLCIQACPVDAIVGAARAMHTVLAAPCTGCDLCIPPCPMDCIAMVATDRAWTDADAAAARRRFDARAARRVYEDDRVAASKLAKAIDKLAHIDETHADDPQLDAKKARVAAAIERARARRRETAAAPAKTQEETR